MTTEVHCSELFHIGGVTLLSVMNLSHQFDVNNNKLKKKNN